MAKKECLIEEEFCINCGRCQDAFYANIASKNAQDSGYERELEDELEELVNALFVHEVKH